MSILSLDIPRELLNPVSAQNHEAEELFAYFISTVRGLEITSMSVAGIPEGISGKQLAKQNLAEDRRNSRSLKYNSDGDQAWLKEFAIGYNQRFAEHDRNHDYSLQARDSFLYSFDLAPSGSREFHQENNVNSTLVIPLYSSRHKSWKLRMLIHSRLDNKSFSKELHQQSGAFRNEVRHLYFELMEQFEDRLNPFYLDKSHIHTKAIQSLQLLAEGYSTKVISGKLHLTEKGVEYHLKTMRSRLGAQNRTQLVSRAYELGLL